MSLAFLVLAGTVTAQSGAQAAPAACVGTDADTGDPEARESLCLQELGNRASRSGNVLSLKLDNGTAVRFVSDPEACNDDNAEKCMKYFLVGFHPASGRYLVFAEGYEDFECRLVSARTGEAVSLKNIPHFAPNGSTFFVTGFDNTYNNWLGIGAMAPDPPALMWENKRDNDEEWDFVRWIDNDRVALRTTTESEACPHGDCDAVLKRTGGNHWEFERLPPRP